MNPKENLLHYNLISFPSIVNIFQGIFSFENEINIFIYEFKMKINSIKLKLKIFKQRCSWVSNNTHLCKLSSKQEQFGRCMHTSSPPLYLSCPFNELCCHVSVFMTFYVSNKTHHRCRPLLVNLFFSHQLINFY